MIEYEKDAVVHSYITKFIRDHISPNNGILTELEAYAEKESIPIVQPETAKFISALSYIKKPKKILEIGCAIGYSAILLSEGLDENGKIVTLEFNPDMVKIARNNIEMAGLADKIEVVEADAKEYLKTIDEPEGYDYIFLDGPKAHYIYMIEDCKRLLKHGGVLVADNVLYKGMTAEKSLVIRRKITIVKRLRSFIAALCADSEFETSIIPLGDGITLSVKK